MQVQAKGGLEPQPESASKGQKLRSAGANSAVEDAVVAVIALALELERQPEASRIPTQRGTSHWALAGRGRVMRGR